MENKEKANRTLSISIKQWHELSLDGVSTSVSLKLDGESMRPLIRKQKDSVTVLPVYRELKKGDIVLFARNDGAYVVHRVCKISVDEIVTVGDNCIKFDAPVPILSVLGIVVRLERNGKIYNLDSTASRIYGILRMSTISIRFIWWKFYRFAVKTVKKVVAKDE